MFLSFVQSEVFGCCELILEQKGYLEGTPFWWFKRIGKDKS